MPLPTDPIAAVRTPFTQDRLLIRPSYQPGDYDSNSVDAPFLFWHEGRYRILLNCYDGIGYRTALASSDDLIAWERGGPILNRGEPGSPTEFNAAIPGILRDTDLYGRGDALLVDGKLVGVWHGYPDKGQEQGAGYFGLAYGNSLTDWTLEPACLTPDNDAAPWERGGLYKPTIIRHANRFFIFYNAKEALDWPWHEQIGMAWSDDLVHWTRCPANPIVPNGGPGAPDEIFCADPCILRHEGIWVMFYYGLSRDGHARELIAFSDDLLSWRKGDEILVDVGPPGSVDARYAHKPGVIARDGILYHFYGASRDKTADDVDAVNAKDRRGIGLATSRPLVL